MGARPCISIWKADLSLAGTSRKLTLPVSRAHIPCVCHHVSWRTMGRGLAIWAAGRWVNGQSVLIGQTDEALALGSALGLQSWDLCFLPVLSLFQVPQHKLFPEA